MINFQLTFFVNRGVEGVGGVEGVESEGVEGAIGEEGQHESSDCCDTSGIDCAFCDKLITDCGELTS